MNVGYHIYRIKQASGGACFNILKSTRKIYSIAAVHIGCFELE